MDFTPRKLNLFLAFKLPSAFLTGVRTRFLDDQRCVVVVKHRWINQNPFRSMFWAVQGMAAELSTGALLMMKIKASNKSILTRHFGKYIVVKGGWEGGSGYLVIPETSEVCKHLYE